MVILVFGGFDPRRQAAERGLPKDGLRVGVSASDTSVRAL